MVSPVTLRRQADIDYEASVCAEGETPKVERLEVVLNWDAGLDGVRDYGPRM